MSKNSDQPQSSPMANFQKKPGEAGTEKAADQPQPQSEAPSEGPAKKAAHEEPSDSWPIQADRMAMRMPLIDCLHLLAGHFGRRTSIASLTAGLPVAKEGISPNVFSRAANRADMNAVLVERSLEALAIAPNLPCVLTLAEGQSCILWGIKHPQKKGLFGKAKGHNTKITERTGFIVQFPETKDKKQVLSLGKLKEIYGGYAFFVRPIARDDDRAGPAEIDTARSWFWSVFKKNKILYWEVVVAAIMINMFAVTSSLYVMNVYDRVVPNAAFETLWALAAGISIVYLFDFALKQLRTHFLDYAGRKADITISAELFEQILGMTMQARPASAGILASKMKEFETIRDFFTSATMVLLIDLPFVLVFLLLIGFIGGPLAFVPMAGIPAIVLMGIILQKPLERVIKESLNESALKNALLFETITGLETIKVQASEGNMQRRWEELNDKSSRTTVKSRQVSSFAQNYSVWVQQMVSVVIVIVGVFLITEGALTMGGLIACVILSGRAMAPLAQVAGLLTRFNQSKQSLEHLDEMMRRPVERPKGTHFVTMPHFEGNIEFREVMFSYPEQTAAVLNNVNFTINAGERVGIIGAVGSGKTTIERLLLNLYQPTGGSVQLDGTDVRQIDPGDLRRNIGAVQQSPHLFYGSVRENITMGHETASDSAVLRAAELAGVMEFLKDSQAGLDTQVGERGEALSGGQRQSVAIARSLLYDPPILVLDEPTASMDPASENRLRKRLGHLTKGKTTILITHKGAMLDIVEKLILIDRGKLIAFGPKDEVIRKLQAKQYGTSAENTKV